MNGEQINQAKQRLSRYMSRTHRKNTRQREVIVDVFLTMDRHLSLQELLEEVQKQEPNIGFATVYRTMKLLVEADVAHERHFAQGNTQYEPAHKGDHHDHLICTICDHIFEFEDMMIEDRQSQIAAQHGLSIRSHRHEIYGECEHPKTCEHRLAAERRST